MAKRAKKTDFRGCGKPSTEPGSPEDAQRIHLSQWLTSILIAYGDEKPGDYHTPGMFTIDYSKLTLRADARQHVVVAPPLPKPSLEPVVILAHGETRQHWYPVCLLGFESDYLYPDRRIMPPEPVWTWEGHYLSLDSLRYLVTGFIHNSTSAAATHH